MNVPDLRDKHKHNNEHKQGMHVRQHKKTKNTHAQCGPMATTELLVLAEFTDVHTGETSKDQGQIQKRKAFLFLVVVLVLISCMFTLEFSYAFACS